MGAAPMEVPVAKFLNGPTVAITGPGTNDPTAPILVSAHVRRVRRAVNWLYGKATKIGILHRNLPAVNADFGQ